VDVPEAFFEPCGVSVALKEQAYTGVSGAPCVGRMITHLPIYQPALLDHAIPRTRP
jgi:hypothetical protein